MYDPDGLMPAGGPQTVLNVLHVLSGFGPTAEGHTVDVSKTYTDDFAR